MISNTLPFEWSEIFKGYVIIGVEIKKHNGIKIGYGAREISDWLSDDLQYSIHSVNR